MTHDETARMAQSLRAMANRTGNAAAEKTMRDAAAISKFMDSGEDVATISALASRDENSDVLGEVAPAQADVLTRAAARMGAPVAARKCGKYIVLERTDRRAAP